MYTRSYADNEISIPEKYGGTVLEEIEKARCGDDSFNECKDSTEDKGERPIIRDILKKIGISVERSAIEDLIPKIGYEEMLIIGLAFLLFFCSNPDRECAMILLALIFIK
jgi:hypothetical protein